MLNTTYVIKRDSTDEVTVAVLVVQFTQKAAGSFQSIPKLLNAIQLAMTDWVKTTVEGAAAWENSSHDFNIGDLANEGLEEVNSRLKKIGIHIVSLDVSSMDSPESVWTFDTKLVTED